MELQFSAKTDVGIKRKVNEDCVYVNEQSGLCAVADGMGGHSAGDVASRMVIDIIEESFSDFQPSDDESIKEAINETIQLANYAVKMSASQNPEQRGMGSTITLLYFFDNKYYIAQVGDSRAYLIRDNQISQITEDHSLVQQELDKGLITEAEAESHVFKNIITRAIGIKDEVEVDFYNDRVMEDDIFLLCTDGLTNKVSNLDILKEATSPKPLDTITSSLIELANLRDGSDNISIVIMKIGSQVKEKSVEVVKPKRKLLYVLPIAAILIIAAIVLAYRYIPWPKKTDTKIAHLEATPTGEVRPTPTSVLEDKTPVKPPDMMSSSTEQGITAETGVDMRKTPEKVVQVPTASVKATPIPTQKPLIKPPTIEPTSAPPPTPRKTQIAKPTPQVDSMTSKPPLDTGTAFGEEMGDTYQRGLEALYEQGIPQATKIWNDMLYQTKKRYTLKIETDRQEKSVFSAFERYSDYKLFVLKKGQRYHVFAGLFSSSKGALQALEKLPAQIKKAGPIVQTVSSIRMKR
ncbi:Stp1/IreP family PP2C-type Ser/Thr phosphatase [candidate division CSSED10-310 bacterium]|uniref:Stp1/IreP family PP2C-type Ser/Thr phosphatase n=1 Tax=candidate division CSSED10-310 bacterium TaxID=2855610 RepID=A0ABV6Z514_UNCC1